MVLSDFFSNSKPVTVVMNKEAYERIKIKLFKLISSVDCL